MIRKKRILAFLFILILSLSGAFNAFADDCFSLRGLSFGMSREEVIGVLGSPEEEDWGEGWLKYRCSFSKYTADSVFSRWMSDENQVVAMGYHKTGCDSGDFDYLKGALSQKYGSEKELRDQVFPLIAGLFAIPEEP